VAVLIKLLLLFDSPEDTENVLALLHSAEISLQQKCLATKVEFLSHLDSGWDIVVADYSLSDFSTLEALCLLEQENLSIPFIIINGIDSAPLAIKYIKAGATDYLLNEELPRLPEVIENALETKKQLAVTQLTKQLHTSQTTDIEQQLREQTIELRRQTKAKEQECIQRRKVEAALDKSEKQLQTLITQNPDGIVVVDKQGIVRFVNPAAIALFNCQEQELLEQLLGFPVLGGDLTEVDVCTFPRKIAQMRVVEIDWQGEYASLVSLRDITERKKAEEERAILLEQAQAANRIKDEFLAILSHELRTPLNPILGWTKILRTRKLDASKMNQALETIERNACLQVQLIDDLLDVARILRGKISLHPSIVDLKTIISAAIETVRLAAQAKSIEINTVFDTDVGLVFGDINRLQQIVWNILTNAIKFTPNGGKVTVHLNEVNSYAQIEIQDTGKGIHPEFLPHVFDYFRQEDSSISRTVTGLGLGLAIVRHLVELHGGTVVAHSDGEGKGATFTIWLPLMANSSDTPENSQDDNGDLNLKGVRLLVVDDEPDNRDFLAFLLESYGASLRTAASAQEALSIIAQEQPDLLVSDIGMPQEDGYELLRKVRSLPPECGGQIPAIAITAYAGESDRQQALAAGFMFHVPKPIEASELVSAIAQLVGVS
jgi:signal transduction histidine kinase/response regulator RpfG family c-di-GMP phosphodiesterase